MQNDLETLFVKYGTDKGYLGGSGWGYTSAYEKYLEHRRDATKNVLEIGICGYRDIVNNVVGASLFAWRDYFPTAHITGLDNDGQFIFNDQDRITTYLCDAYDQAALLGVMAKNDVQYDFIVDDAVHDPIPQLNLLNDLWPFLAEGGVYAIEDVCLPKLPHNNIEHMLRYIPKDVSNVEIFTTHKDERLIILTR